LITLYVLKGKTGKRYVGITNILSRRLEEHRSRKTKGSQLLDEFFVLHKETFSDYKSARRKEKFLKSGQGRRWLDELEIESEPAKDRRIKQSPKEACAPSAHSNPLAPTNKILSNKKVTIDHAIRSEGENR